MTKKICHLTELDVTRLEKHAEKQAKFQDMLDDLLAKAEIIASHAIKPDVVTMNSVVTLEDKQLNENTVWTVTYPDDANFNLGKLNVFSPVGMALLGAKIGEDIHITLPNGKEKTLTITGIVFQPEASGDFVS